jgi:hypothetical protein
MYLNDASLVLKIAQLAIEAMFEGTFMGTVRGLELLQISVTLNKLFFYSNMLLQLLPICQMRNVQLFYHFAQIVFLWLRTRVRYLPLRSMGEENHADSSTGAVFVLLLPMLSSGGHILPLSQHPFNEFSKLAYMPEISMNTTFS